MHIKMFKASLKLGKILPDNNKCLSILTIVDWGLNSCWFLYVLSLSIAKALWQCFTVFSHPLHTELCFTTVSSLFQ